MDADWGAVVMVRDGRVKCTRRVRGDSCGGERARGEGGVKMIAAAREMWATDTTRVLPAQYHQYQVVGRHVPTEAQPEPEVFRMKLWALDSVKARSKFWYVGRLG